MKRVLVLMSGGVDSSFAALTLKKRGYYCEGLTLILKSDVDENEPYVRKAKEVCEKLGIKHKVVDFSKEFREEVIDRFISVYEEGKTPNPCILCNTYFKFGRILKLAQTLNYDYIATGHYAAIVYSEEKKRWLLRRSKNINKDQSYFLYFLKQDQLSKILFPLEDLDKDEVRRIAFENGLNFEKVKESQDICFVGKDRYYNFIEKNSKKKWEAGNFVDTSGNVLGVHKGVVHYTIGQRKGIGLSFKKPMFVKEIDFLKNEIVLAQEEELFEKVLYAKNFNLISRLNLKEKVSCKAKVRYRQQEEDAVVQEISNDMLKIEFLKEQRAIAKGQAVVLYEGDYVLGGGEIC